MVTRGLRVLTFMVLGAGGPTAFATYEIIDLGTASGPTISSGATGINDAGQVVGWQFGAAPSYFVWDHGTYTSLGSAAYPYAINNDAQVVGTASPGHAFIWQNGIMSDLGTMGYSTSVASAVNDSGDVAGYAYNTNQSAHGFIYHDSVMTEILAPTTGGVEVFGMNNARQVVGGYSGAYSSRAFAWQDGTLTDLVGVYGEANGSVAWDINNAGQVVGVSWVQGVGIRRATLWKNGQAIDLGLTGDARAINDRGQIVGSAERVGAFLYQDGTVISLNTLLPANSGWSLGEPLDINESGWIVGHGWFNGSQHAFLLTPEPATLLLILTGLFIVKRR